jgi:hypothetical protein
LRCEIRTGGDGVACWNSDAIQSYVDETTRRETGLSERNPDLVVVPGRISCYGCEAQEYDYAPKCTAKITKTLYAVPGEVQPRAADAIGWHREIPGLLTIRPESAADPVGGQPASAPAAVAPAAVAPAENPPAAATPTATAPAPTSTRSTRLRGLFNR